MWYLIKMTVEKKMKFYFIQNFCDIENIEIGFEIKAAGNLT